MNKKSFWKFRKVIIAFIALTIALTFPSEKVFGQTSWTAPKSANNLKNPYKNDKASLQKGKTLYKQYCAICHGEKGKGDGMAGMSLKPRPANLTKEAFFKQTDGAVFWKLTEGKPPMAAYKTVLTKEQRWQLVSYIKSLRK
ncbi:MAG: cytochrome c [Bacteroidetes bacterium]|nr:MAG: cytochrome c [Bacteroidota bacterium]